MRYVIKYSTGDMEVKVVRKATSAIEAIEKLTSQYWWSWKLSLVDADTRGNEWCTGKIDTFGGINYVGYIEAIKES